MDFAIKCFVSLLHLLGFIFIALPHFVFYHSITILLPFYYHSITILQDNGFLIDDPLVKCADTIETIAPCDLFFGI